MLTGSAIVRRGLALTWAAGLGVTSPQLVALGLMIQPLCSCFLAWEMGSSFLEDLRALWVYVCEVAESLCGCWGLLCPCCSAPWQGCGWAVAAVADRLLLCFLSVARRCRG